MPLADAFEPLRSVLEHAGVRYAIGGSWASTAFGEPRFTNDVDILAEFTEDKLHRFLRNLPSTFYADEEEALKALRDGRPFNVLQMQMALKFDFFPATAFPLGIQELERAIRWPARNFRKRLSYSLLQKTFCWPNCIGLGWVVRYPKYNGAIS